MTEGEFRTLFMDWLNRSDCTSTKADTFISQGYDRIAQDVRSPLLEATYTPSADVDGIWRAVSVPSGHLKVKAFVADGKDIKPKSSSWLLRQQPFAGCPQNYALLGAQWLLWPYATTSLSIYAYQKVKASGNDANTNSILTDHHTLLLWAALSFAGDFYKVDDVTTWEARYQAEKDAENALGEDQEYEDLPAVQAPEGMDDYL